MDPSKIFVVDMRSDTVTKPTPAMRQAMATAIVDDDVYAEDPTVNALEKRMATLTGKEAALFVPSGTMGNLISVMVHCDRRGAELIVGDKSHIFKYEQGGVSQFGSVLLTTVKNNPDGTFDLEDVRKIVRGDDIHEPKTMMIAVENTHSFCGGKVIPLEWLDKLAAFAKQYSLILHVDGARIFNAAEHLQVTPKEVLKHFDSASICFSKGLGCPAGSLIVGTSAFIKQARRLRRALGGGMRQVGVLAGPALVALDDIVPALGADHKRAKTLGNALEALNSPTFSVYSEDVQTNMVMVYLDEKYNLTADKVVARLRIVTENEIKDGCVTDKGEGINLKICCMSDKLLRITTHYDLTDMHINYAIKKLNYVFKEMECKKSVINNHTNNHINNY